MLTVKAPATTANIAAGFDCFGICLDMNNTYTFDDFEDAIVVNNYADTFRNKENLVVKSFLKTAEIMNKKVNGLKLNIHTEIPLARGLGSSASCISAGVAAAYYYFEKEIDYNDVFYIAAMLEGHPDNVCPSIFGGGCVSYKKDGIFKHTAFSVPEKYKFIAVIPNYELSTEKARQVLPENCSLQDAVFNISRAALLVKGFITDDTELIRDGLDDRLHQPYRIPLIKNYESVRKAAMENGALGMYLSGAGPTMMVVADNENVCGALKKSLFEHNMEFDVRPLCVNNHGLEIKAE